MPISINRFNKDDGSTLTIREGTNKWRVLTFLLNNNDKAYTRQEIVENVDITENSIGPVLTRLKDMGLIRYKSGYWTTSHDDRLGSIAGKVNTADTLDEKFGQESRQEWAHTEDN